MASDERGSRLKTQVGVVWDTRGEGILGTCTVSSLSDTDRGILILSISASEDAGAVSSGHRGMLSSGFDTSIGVSNPAWGYAVSRTPPVSWGDTLRTDIPPSSTSYEIPATQKRQALHPAIDKGARCYPRAGGGGWLWLRGEVHIHSNSHWLS